MEETVVPDIVKPLRSFIGNQISENWADYLTHLVLLFLLVLVCFLSWKLTRYITANLVLRLVRNTKTKWDDLLYSNKVFKTFSHVVPIIIIDRTVGLVFYVASADVQHWITKLAEAGITFVLMLTMNKVLSAFQQLLMTNKKLKGKPVASYVQLAKIVVFITFGILLFSILFDKSPFFFLSAMGAMTAIILLIFKDTILGFVGSIQLAANDMLRLGDWVSVPKYGADGDVIEINLATVKIRNFDKTITTIPTYAFISDSFKNWRGMQESTGRRIKRTILVDLNSVQFCSDELLLKLEKLQLLTTHIANKKNEISAYNTQREIDKSVLANGRHLTNIGLFRQYAQDYLNNNPNIHTKMTCMVRQLEATENGLPIEIYAFSKNKEWIAYEEIMADIFDHMFATIPYFELAIFQAPSGQDFKNLK